MLRSTTAAFLAVVASTSAYARTLEVGAAKVMIGAEGVTQMTPEIIVENNTFRNNGVYPTIFVDNLIATEAQLSGNTISGVGPVEALKSDGMVFPNK